MRTSAVEGEIARCGDAPVLRFDGIRSALGAACSGRATGRALVFVDERVMHHHGAELLAAVEEVGSAAIVGVVPSGEASKDVAHLASLWSAMVHAGVQRRDRVVAIGGGVTTDLVGFAASTILRGVEWVPISTTVLGMADAAIGGKTGIDLPEGKNLAGSFAMPERVVLWTGALRTLPERELRAGLAEVVKSAWIAGEAEVRSLEQAGAALTNAAGPELAASVAMAARVKAEIVTADPHEQGLRRVLNLGHTLGHAVETALGPDAIVHGEAIAIGLVLAFRFGAWLGEVPAEDGDRIARLLRDVGLRVDAPVLAESTWMDLISRDKKAVGETIGFIAPRAPGRVDVVPVMREKFAI